MWRAIGASNAELPRGSGEEAIAGGVVVAGVVDRERGHAAHARSPTHDEAARRDLAVVAVLREVGVRRSAGREEGEERRAGVLVVPESIHGALVTAHHHGAPDASEEAAE